MKYSFAKESIKIDKIIKKIEQDGIKYNNAILVNNSRPNYLTSYSYIKIIESTIEENLNADIFQIVKSCLKTLLYEKEDNDNFYYFISVLLRAKMDNILYKAISHIYSSSPIGVELKKERQLLDSMIYIADTFLFINCNMEQSMKWYYLINKSKFHCENKFSPLANQGLLKYAVEKDTDEKGVHFCIALFDDSNSKNDVFSLDLLDFVYKYYFSIKAKLTNIDEARGVFSQMLSIVNNTIVRVIKEATDEDIEENEKNILKELFFMSYNNDFSPYITHIVDEGISTYNIILLISKSIDQINMIKQKLLVNKKDDIKLAYYTNINSFSYMLPYRNKDNKIGMLPLMNISYMNDPTEGTVLFKYLSINNKNGQRKTASLPFIYIKSFTSLIDYLPMWEMYADRGKEICIVLDWNKIKKEECEIYRICYVDTIGLDEPRILEDNNKGLKVNEIEKCLNNLRDIRNDLNEELRETFDNSLQQISYLFKDSHYYSENESRVLITDTNYDDMTFSTIKDKDKIDVNNCPYLYKYANFIPYIKEIIIGPKYENADYNFPFIKSQIEKMCKEINADLPRITYSDINYR